MARALFEAVRTEQGFDVGVELLGEATWDPAAARFTAFDLVALGERRGRTRFNGRGRDRDPDGWHGIGFAFTLPTSASRVPPGFIELYDADWVIRPGG